MQPALPRSRPCFSGLLGLAVALFVPAVAQGGAFVLETKLTSDIAGEAFMQDPLLTDPVGIAESTGSPVWVADRASGLSTLYVTGPFASPIVQRASLVVSIPSPSDPLGASGAPTGDVFNSAAAPGTKSFAVSGIDSGGAPASASALFLFATVEGTILGWNPAITPPGSSPQPLSTHAIIAVDKSVPDKSGVRSAYRGLTMATDSSGNTLLYAADFGRGTIDVFDKTFAPATLGPEAFTDPSLPRGFAPYNVEALNGHIFVTYAKQNDTRTDAAPGTGFVDEFDLNGASERRLVSRGVLDAPWGLAIAPASFGSLAGALLVGNHGNGFIDAFDVDSGAFLAQLADPAGRPLAIDGLWALNVGNGRDGGAANAVLFTAGLNGGSDGLFGDLVAVAPAPQAVPEPGSLALLSTAVTLLGLLRCIPSTRRLNRRPPD